MTRLPVRLVWLVLAMLSVNSLAACTSSLNLIGPLETAVPAPELLGTWVAEECASPTQNPGESVYLHIMPLKAADKKQIEIVLVFIDTVSADNGGWAIANGYVTVLHDGRFVNLRFVAGGPDKGPDKQFQRFPYFFVVYKLNPGHKLVIGGTSDALDEGAHAGRLANACGKDMYSVCLTDSSADIARYLGSLDEATLFKNQCVFRKVE